VTMADGGSISIQNIGSSFVIQQGASSVTAAHGNEISMGAHVFSAASDGEDIVIDHSITHLLPSAAKQPPAFATFVAADGGVVTASRQSSVIVLADGTQTLTAHFDSTVKVGSQDVVVAADGEELVAGSSTIRIPADIDRETDGPTAVWTSGLSTFAAIAQGASVVVHGPDITATLAAGVTSSIAGEVFGVPSSGNLLVHDGSTLTLKAGKATGTGAAVTLLQDGIELVASAADDAIVVQQGTSTFTLAAWQETTVEGHKLSAARSGLVLVVDGTETVSLPTGTSKSSLDKTSETSDSRNTGTTRVVEGTASGSISSQTSVDSSHAGSKLMLDLGLCVLCVLLFSCVWIGLAPS
jgi:hypothetical protein